MDIGKLVISKSHLPDDLGFLQIGMKNLMFWILKITIPKSNITSVFIPFSKSNIP